MKHGWFHVKLFGLALLFLLYGIVQMMYGLKNISQAGAHQAGSKERTSFVLKAPRDTKGQNVVEKSAMRSTFAKGNYEILPISLFFIMRSSLFADEGLAFYP